MSPVAEPSDWSISPGGEFTGHLHMLKRDIDVGAFPPRRNGKWNIYDANHVLTEIWHQADRCGVLEASSLKLVGWA